MGNPGAGTVRCVIADDFAIAVGTKAGVQVNYCQLLFTEGKFVNQLFDQPAGMGFAKAAKEGASGITVLASADGDFQRSLAVQCAIALQLAFTIMAVFQHQGIA